jgi:hypothetical protein
MANGRCPLCNREENAVDIFLKCKERERWREQFLNDKWLYINEEIARKNIIICTKVTIKKMQVKYSIVGIIREPILQIHKQHIVCQQMVTYAH